MRGKGLYSKEKAVDGRGRGLLWKHGHGRWHANAIFGRLFERLGADLSEAVKSSMVFRGLEILLLCRQPTGREDSSL